MNSLANKNADALTEKNTETPLSPRERMENAHNRLSSIRNTLTSRMLNLLDEVALLEDAGNSHIEIEALLQDCGYTYDQIETLLQFRERLTDHKEAIKAGNIDFSTVKALMLVDDRARRAAFMDINTDPSVGAESVREIARQLKNNAVSLEVKFHEASQQAFHVAFEAIALQQEASFRAKASVLFQMMRTYGRRCRYARFTPQRFHMLSTSDRFQPFFEKIKELKNRIVNLSRELFLELNSIFPDCAKPMPDWAALYRTETVTAYLAQAHYSLDVMSQGEFAWSLPGEDTPYYRWSSLQAIRFLSDIPPRENGSPARWIDPRMVKNLNAFDISAGVGGSALGVEAAGFYMHGLLDGSESAVSTLRTNRSRWNVFERDITLPVTEADTAMWRGTNRRAANLDLVSGSLPVSPWAYRGDGQGELFTSSVDYIRNLNPKAFFFETDVGFIAPRHAAFRQALLKQFRDLGFSMRIWTLDAAKLGLPQKRTRVYLVGIQKEFAPNLTPPRLDVTKGIGAAVWAKAFPYLSEFMRQLLNEKLEGATPLKKANVRRLEKKRSEDQKLYDKWAAAWISEYGQHMAPDVGKYSMPPTGKIAAAWTKVGFDATKKPGVSLGDARLNRFKSAKATVRNVPKVRLTASIIQCLQGMPPDWVLDSDEDVALQQACSLRPPVMALAVARRIHQAISGQSVNLKDPKAREITSGRNRLIPGFIIGQADHPDPMGHLVQGWADLQYEKARLLADDSNGDDD